MSEFCGQKDESSLSTRSGALSGLEESLKLVTQAESHGVKALVDLQTQEENLAGAADTVESTDYTLQKSMRVLRGMTWSGAIYNMFTSEPTAAAAAVGGTPILNQSANPNHINNSQTQTQSDSESSTGIRKEKTDEALDEVFKGVENLKALSQELGHKIVSNHEQLDSFETQVEANEDSMLAVTLRAAQLTQRSNRSKEKYIGTYQLVHEPTGKVLYLLDDDLLLAEVGRGSSKDRATLFACYRKETHLLGLQSLKTRKWLGITWLGDIKVGAQYFGKSEELHVDLSGRPGGVFFLACNWYSGGWMTTPSSNPGVKTMLKPTTGLRDKEGRVVVRAMKTVDPTRELREREDIK